MQHFTAHSVQKTFNFFFPSAFWIAARLKARIFKSGLVFYSHVPKHKIKKIYKEYKENEILQNIRASTFTCQQSLLNFFFRLTFCLGTIKTSVEKSLCKRGMCTPILFWSWNFPWIFLSCYLLVCNISFPPASSSSSRCVEKSKSQTFY